MHADSSSLRTQVLSVGPRGHGCRWQIPQSPRPVVLLLHGCQVHINNECAKRRSVCVALLFLVRELCLKLGSVVLTRDFNKGAERELAPGGEHHGNKWSECCGFVMLPETQNQWLVMRHGSFNVVPASIGLKPTDQMWHHEQWMHLKFARRKRRRDASPSDSKSSDKCNLHPRVLEQPASHQPASYLQPALHLRTPCNPRCKPAAIQPSLQPNAAHLVQSHSVVSSCQGAPPSRFATRCSLRSVVSSMPAAWTPSNMRRSFVFSSRTFSTPTSRWKRGTATRNSEQDEVPKVWSIAPHNEKVSRFTDTHMSKKSCYLFRHSGVARDDGSMPWKEYYIVFGIE